MIVRVAVVGSRGYRRLDLVLALIRRLHAHDPAGFEILSGTEPGTQGRAGHGEAGRLGMLPRSPRQGSSRPSRASRRGRPDGLSGDREHSGEAPYVVPDTVAVALGEVQEGRVAPVSGHDPPRQGGVESLGPACRVDQVRLVFGDDFGEVHDGMLPAW